jgi:hypothetical protein
MFNTVEKRRRRVSNKQKQTKNNIDWSEYASTLAKALCASNKGINSREGPACICGHGFEDCIHIFFECPFYNKNRAILFN